MGRGGSFGGGSRGGGGSFSGGGRSGSFGGGRSRGSSSSGGSRGGSVFGGSGSSGRSSSGSSGWNSGRSSSGSSGGGFGSGFLGGLAGGALSGRRGGNTSPAGGSNQSGVPGGPAGGGTPSITPPAGTQTKKGCGKPLIIIAAVIAGIILLAIVWKLAGGGGDSDIVRSTVAREALPAGSVTETGYYTDTIGVVEDRQQLEKGLKYFYEKTGVQPYVYMVDEVGGSANPTGKQLEQFARDRYSELFKDEAHFLLVYFEQDEAYQCSYYVGDRAASVMDQEATDILDGYFGRYYYDTSLTYDEFFSKVFEATADRIMEVSKPGWYALVWVLGILGAGGIAVLGFFWWKHAKKQRNLEAEQTAAILNTPLETFEDAQTEQLEGKYGEQARPPDPAPTTFGDAEVDDLAKKYEESQPKQ